MLGIGQQWKNWVGYSEFGTAYFGINSIPIKVCENIYQIKCLCSKHCNHSEYEMKYLQFNLSTTNITLNFLNSLKNNYVKEMDFCGYFTDNPNVYIVGECENPKNITPCSYNAKQIHSLFLRLSKLKIQDKPILK
jgi:hypothetical protein